MNNKSIVYYSLLCAMCCSFLFKESALCMKNNKTEVESNKVQSNPVARLYSAIRENDSIRVESALDKCSVSEANTARRGLVFTPLGYAIALQSENSFAALLASSKIDVNVPMADGHTALVCAVAGKNIKALNDLLACERVEVNATISGTETALGCAVLGKNIEALNALLACKRVDVNEPGEDGLRAIEFAIAGGNPAILKALFTRDDLDIAGTGPRGLTPLEFAKSIGNAEIIELLEEELARRKELSASPKGELKVEDVD